MLMWILAGPAVAADCPEPVSVETFGETLASAQWAFSSLELEAFTTHMDDAAYAVPCLDQALSAETVATYHRLQGLRQFVAQNEQLAVEAFAASRHVEPDFVLPDELVPPGHEVRQLYALMPLENGTFSPVGEPVSGTVAFDGTPGLSRPDSWPTVVQLFDEQGQVTATAYVAPGDALPAYEALKVEAPPLANIPWIKTRKQLTLLASGLAAGVVSGGLYGSAAVSAKDYTNPHPDYDEAALTAHERRTNGLVLGSAGVGVAGAALITSSFLVVTW